MDEKAGKLVAKFENFGRAITYEMRLGPPMEAPPSAEELVNNPELTTYQVDARVLDQNGQAFHLQMGGDSFIDSTWTMPNVIGFDEAGRSLDFRLLAEAIDDFRALRVPASLEQLRLTGIEIGRSLEIDTRKPELEEEQPDTAVDPGGLLRPQADPVLASGPGSVAKWDFLVRKKCFPSCAVGNHSSVFLRGWSTNSIVFRAYSCNHGTCASNTSVMVDHCTMPGFRTDDGTNTRFFYTESSGSSNARHGGCTTSYNVSSVRGHNCNDDSELQGRAIWHDKTQSRDSGSCNSLGAHNWAPGCSY